MTDTNPRAVVGANNPPDPIDEATAPFADVIDEAQNWADGEPVKDDAQMKAVDALLKDIKAARKAVDTARDEVTKPLHAAWKAEIARWKPTQDDLDRLAKCLIAAVAPYKREKAAQEAEEQRKAWEAANAARRAAEEAERTANAASIAAQREIESAKQAAIDAENAAKVQAKSGTKGLRTVTEFVVISRRELALYLWVHDEEAMFAFMDERARKLSLDIPGVVEQRKEKRAF